MQAVPSARRESTSKARGSASRTRPLVAFALALLASLAPASGEAEPPPATPSRFRMTPQVGHAGALHDFAFAPDGRTLATSGGDGAIKVWDVRAGLLLRTIRAHDGAAGQLEFLPDGTLLSSAGTDDDSFETRDHGPLLRRWNLERGELVGSYGRAPVLPGAPRFAVSADGKRVFVVAMHVGRVFDLVSGAELAKLDVPSLVTAVALSGDGSRLAFADDTLFVSVRDVASPGAPQPMSIPHPGKAGTHNFVGTLRFTPDGSQLVSGDRLGYVARWDYATRRPRATCRRGGKLTSPIAGLWVSPDGQEVRTFEALGPMSYRGGGCEASSVPIDTHGDDANRNGKARFSQDGDLVAWSSYPNLSMAPWSGAAGSATTLAVTATNLETLRDLRFVRGKAELAVLYDHRTRFWDLAALAPVRSVEGTTDLHDGGRVTATRAVVDLIPWDGAAASTAVPLPQGYPGQVLGVDAKGARLLLRVEVPRRSRGGTTSTLALLDTASGASTRLVNADGTPVGGESDATLSLDGGRVLTGGDSQLVRSFDATGANVASWPSSAAATRGTSRSVLFPAGDRFAELTDAGVFVRDAVTGATLASWKPHERRAASIALSRDGARAATWSLAEDGVVVADTSTGHTISKLPLRGADVIRLALDGDGGRLAVVGDAGTDIIDVASGRLRVAVPVGQGDAAFSSDGSKLAVGGTIVELATGAQRTVASSCLAGVARLACSRATNEVVLDPEGRTVPGAEVGVPIAIVDGRLFFKVGGREAAVEQLPGEVTRIAMTPDRRRALVAGTRRDGAGGYLGLWDTATGKPERSLGDASLPFAVDAALSQDGRRVLSSHIFGDRERHGELRVWETETGNLVRTIPLPERGAGPLALAADGKRAMSSGAIAGSTSVRTWDLETGRQLGVVENPVPVRAIAVSDDGRFGATGTSERTIRVFQLAAPDTTAVTLADRDEDWVVYTEDGDFDASLGGQRLAAAVTGSSAYRVGQLAVWKNRPDRVAARLGAAPPELVAHFAARHARRLRLLGLDEGSMMRMDEAPEATIESLDRDGRNVTVSFTVRSRSAGLASYQLWVNQVPILGRGGRRIEGASQRLTETIALTSGKNVIEVAATDRSGLESLHPARTVEVDEPSRGDLWYLGVGVSRYANPTFDLAYPNKDVRDLADVLSHAPGFRRVHVKTLTDSMATVPNLRAAKDFLAGAGVDDTVVLAIAGHGLHARTAEAEYYFATHETDPARLAETAAPFDLLEELMVETPARKKLVLLDTCESGASDDDDAAPPPPAGLEARVARQLVLRAQAAAPAPQALAVARAAASRDRLVYDDLLRRSGAVVLAASRGNEASWELPALHNGLFTKAVLWALTRKDTDADEDGRISADELARAVARTVSERTAGMQHPNFESANVLASVSLPRIDAPAALAVLRRTELPADTRGTEARVGAGGPPATRPPHACGCRTVGGDAGDGHRWVLAALAVLAACARRSPRRSPGVGAGPTASSVEHTPRVAAAASGTMLDR